MTLVYYIVIVFLLALVTYMFVQKFKKLGEDNGSIPKEFRPIIYILAFIFVAVVSLLIYTTFFMKQHYNF